MLIRIKSIRAGVLLKSITALLAYILVVIVSTGCSSAQAELPYDNDAIATDLQEQKITQAVENIALPYFEHEMRSIQHSMDEIRRENLIGIVRYNKGRYYSVTPMEDGKFLFLLFNNEFSTEYNVSDGYLASSFADKHNFDHLKVGMPQENVLARDSTAWVDEFGVSSCHHFSDGSILLIDYELDASDKWVVSEYMYTREKESVVRYLIPGDKKLLQTTES